MQAGPIRFRDIALFQVGNPGAIRRLVASRWSLAIGILLIFTAAVARNYDQTFLPWHGGEKFAGPFVVPVISSFLVFIAIYWSGTRRHRAEDHPGFFRQYPGFLGAFLMTAPLAWFYAIPVEAMTGNLLTAAKWNVFFLALVSLWRVWLIARVAQVITGAPFVTLLLAILIPASAEALIGSFYAGFELAGAMGGILPPDEEFTADALNVILTGSFFVLCGAVVASIAIAITRWRKRKGWIGNFAGTWTNPPKKTLLMTVAVALLWVLFAIPWQRKIWNRMTVADLVSSEKFDEAIAFLQSKERRDFPPRAALEGGGAENLTPMLKRLGRNAPPWIRAEYLRAANSAILNRLGGYGPPIGNDFRNLISASAQLPGGREALKSTADLILNRRPRNSPGLSSDEKEIFIAELENAGVKIPDIWRPTAPPTLPPASKPSDRKTH